MTELPPRQEHGAMPENIGSLYSHAQAQGARYGAFSASRKDVRRQFRRPVQSLHPLRELHEQPPQVMEEPAQRWRALRSVFAPAEEPVTAPVVEPPPPLVAAFSMAGGVGKTCLVATLGRVLSAHGEHVLLADTAASGLLPVYFGSRASKPGVVRTFSPAGAEKDAPVQILDVEGKRGSEDVFGDEPLLAELQRGGRGSSRILVDLATASRDVAARLLSLRPTVLVPLLPDISSVSSLRSLEMLLGREDGVYYVLNQFDGSPFHLDVREMLQQKLGDRLLPLLLRRSAAVSEALAEGMTVVDYAPGSPASEDYWNLAGWLRSVSPPAALGRGGVRWSER